MWKPACEDEIGVVLVHGHIRHEVGEVIKGMIGEYHEYEVWCDGGYLLTLATTQDIGDDAYEWVNLIYENEDKIPDIRTDHAYPVFIGQQPEPVEIVTDHDGYSFYLIGGVHGYEEDGSARYSD